MILGAPLSARPATGRCICRWRSSAKAPRRTPTSVLPGDDDRRSPAGGRRLHEIALVAHRRQAAAERQPADDRRRRRRAEHDRAVARRLRPRRARSSPADRSSPVTSSDWAACSVAELPAMTTWFAAAWYSASRPGERDFLVAQPELARRPRRAGGVSRHRVRLRAAGSAAAARSTPRARAARRTSGRASRAAARPAGAGRPSCPRRPWFLRRRWFPRRRWWRLRPRCSPRCRWCPRRRCRRRRPCRLRRQIRSCRPRRSGWTSLASRSPTRRGRRQATRTARRDLGVGPCAASYGCLRRSARLDIPCATPD